MRAQALHVTGSEPSPAAIFAGGGSFQRRVLRMLFAENRALRWLVGGALVEALLGLAGPWIASLTVDTALPNQATNILAVVSILVVVVALHTAWAGWVHDRISIVLTHRIEATCLGLVLERFLRIRFNLLQGRHFGDTNQTMGAAGATSVAISRAAIAVITQTLTGAVYFTVLAAWFPGVAASAAGTALVILLASSFYAHREARHARVTLEVTGQQQQVLHVLLQSIASLRVAGATDRSVNRWKHHLNRQAQAIVAQQSSRVSQGIILDGVPLITSVGVTGWFVSQAMEGEATLGQLMMATSLSASTIACFVSLVGTLVAFQAMKSHLERIDQVLNEGEKHEPLIEAPALCARSDVVMERVSFSYNEGGRPILHDWNCSFPAGRVSVLRAVSGAGKTTILRLLAGLLEPSSGSVRVLGHAPHAYRRLVTYLPQHSVLFQASIADNLRLLSGHHIEEALQIARLTGLSRLLDSLPMGAETIISAVGGNLSAGEKQLVLLTAAFASGRPVVLLDEATSQLDSESQASIDWDALAKGKTVILVQHE